MFVNLQNLHLYDFRDFDTADLIIKATRMFASSPDQRADYKKSLETIQAMENSIEELEGRSTHKREGLYRCAVDVFDQSKSRRLVLNPKGIMKQNNKQFKPGPIQT